jgi:hypothetical protein
MMSQLIRKGTQSESDVVANKLIEYNLSQVPFGQNPPWDKLCLVMCDEAGNIIGGINASLVWGSSLSIHHLWINENNRHQHIGTDLLVAMEDEGRSRGAEMVHLDTTDFQALPFYLQQGYELFGTLEGSPCKGHRRYYLKKSL